MKYNSNYFILYQKNLIILTKINKLFLIDIIFITGQINESEEWHMLNLVKYKT